MESRLWAIRDQIVILKILNCNLTLIEDDFLLKKQKQKTFHHSHEKSRENRLSKTRFHG